MNEIIIKPVDYQTWISTNLQRYSKDLREFDPCMPDQSIEDETNFYNNFVAKNLFLIMGIYDLENHLLGFIQAFELKQLDSDKLEEFVYYKNGAICETGISILEPDNFRKGYGYQAYKLFLDYLKEKYNIQTTTISTYIENQRAIGLYRKLGYQDFGFYEDEGYKYKKMIYQLV